METDVTMSCVASSSGSRTARVAAEAFVAAVNFTAAQMAKTPQEELVRTEAFLQACRKANIQAEIPDDIVKAAWEKFVFLVGLSSATAVARAPIGVVRADADLRWLFEQAMRETWRVGRARGVKLADEYVEQRLAFADGLHADMKASLLHDLEAGGKLEVPWLCGAVARMAGEAGLDAPVNRAVFAALKPHLNGR